ncbi:MAG: hypothetical protein Q9169_000005 [Polycauliona sp. 2 TL-2023]
MLVAYSESEGSEAEEEKQKSSKPPKATTNSTKPTFQKVVDRSNPHKIRVNLPELDKDAVEDKEDEEGPPAKKARVGGGSFGGFNSFLPAPKRAAAANGGVNGSGARRGGLGSGVSLKTGAAPGFSREPMSEGEMNNEEDTHNVGDEPSFQKKEHQKEEASTGTRTNGLSDPSNAQPIEKSPKKPQKQGNAMMFKPLSVARKPQKKKPTVPTSDGTLAPKRVNPAPPQPKSVPKASLFSTHDARDEHINGTTTRGDYQPLIYGAQESEDAIERNSPPSNPYTDDPITTNQPIAPPEPTQGPQSLDTIASDLNLSASAKRQLLGRQNRNASAINVVNFNTDQEYAANEMLRQAGEQVQHNPVRAIAPGKHSLKQLVNAASNQKDALEEHFASGRRNKKEAGSKYGW